MWVIMRIFYDHQIFSEQKYGGISRYFASLAGEIARLNLAEVRIASPLCINEYLPELSPENRSGITLPSAIKPGWLIRRLNRVLSGPVALRFNPDIIHETYYWDQNKAARPLLGVATTVHDMIHETFPGNFSPGDKTAARKLAAVKKADLVICVSENTRRDLLERTGIARTKTVVVHHGADHMPPGDNPLPPVISGAPYLLYVGQRSGYKNFDRLLKAFAADRELQVDYRLVCFGGGALTEEERAAFSHYGLQKARVLQVDGGDDMLASLYKQAEVFIYPSLYEGFGIPPLEAMASGCPVISSDVSSMPEILGDAAEYFQPEDTQLLLAAITRVLNSAEHATNLKESGLRRAKNYTWKKCAEETLLAYSALA